MRISRHPSRYFAMKKNRVWLVFTGCMLMYGALMGILFNCTGVLITGIIKAEGYTSSSVSGFYTMRTFVTAIAMLFTAKLFTRFPIKAVIVTVGIVSSLAYYLMYFYTAPWQWTISGILCGLATSLSFLLPSSVIRAWFVKKRGTFMGIFTMLSGFLGAFLNPVISAFMEHNGWRATALLLASTSLAMMLIAALLIERSPADVGALPFGGTEADIAAAPVQKKSEKVPLQPKIYLFVFFAISVSSMCIQSTSYIPQYSTSLGHPLMVGATLTSAIMIGNLSAKFLFGIVSDILGVWRSTQIFFGLVGAAYLGFLFFGGSLAMMYVSSVLLGFTYMSGVALSLVCVELFDPAHYEVQYSRVSLIGSLISSLVPTFIASVFDSTGSFKPVFAVFAGLLAFSIVLISLRSVFGIGRKEKVAV